jgi:hypothetical protein
LIWAVASPAVATTSVGEPGGCDPPPVGDSYQGYLVLPTRRTIGAHRDKNFIIAGGKIGEGLVDVAPGLGADGIVDKGQSLGTQRIIGPKINGGMPRGRFHPGGSTG